jgi:D-alanyl-D-alanine carboxypeptidase/D-alanyl-D-alanine-endopeptidase (penicillin-binding protein 4)
MNRGITWTGMRSGTLALLLVSAACARTAPAGPPGPPAWAFARFADSVLSTPPLHRAHIGIQVYDPATRRVLYSHNADRHFVPASNQKYWPTATALQVLGPDWRYRTPILGVGFDAASGEAAALVVVGRGDPTWSERFHPEGPDVLSALADSLVAVGLKRVRGDLVVDASYFDESIIPGTWTFGNLNGTSAPPTGAFAVGEGVMTVVVEPGPAVGAATVVTPAAPAGVVPLLNRVVTAEPAPEPAQGPGGGRGFVSGRGPWSDTLRLTGTLALGSEPQTLRLPMTDAVRFASHAFAGALRARGVIIDGAVRVVADSAEVAALLAPVEPVPVVELTAWTSAPMSDVVRHILQPSQNWIAEQLVRTLGAEMGEAGSWREGIAVQQEFLFNTVGIDSAALSLQDGSGMSHQNLVTPAAVVQLLDHARTAPWGQVFRDGLTGPGRPGTLANRMKALEGRITGKTGTLSNVNALSGYVTTDDGRELIFSFLSNASGLGGAPVVSALDRMVEVLASAGVPR